MPDADYGEFVESSRPRPVRPAAQDHGPQPSPGKVVLWIGVGCFTLVTLISVIIVVGISAVWTIVKDQIDVEKADEVQEVVSFKVGDSLPDPPLQLSSPPPPASRLGKIDLANADPRQLAAAAQHFYESGNYQAAIQCQYILVIKTDRGRYNLACYYGRAGDVQASLYWLQAGAKDEESDADWASRDSDLVAVRNDRRWPQLRTYLGVYQRYWETRDLSESSLVLPRNAPAGTPLPVFIGLHGTGHNGPDFVDAETYQPLADQMGVAFLGVSGTVTHGKHNFTWSEDLTRDLARIDAALQEVAPRVIPRAGQTVLFGFSQGGWVAGELAARHPDRFAGAILLSAGCRLRLKMAEVKPQPEHLRQGIVVVCGAGENPSTVAHTQRYAALFEKLGARVDEQIYPGMNTHSFPPDFREKFPIWGRYILNQTASVATPQQ